METYRINMGSRKVTVNILEGAKDRVIDYDLDEFRLAKLVKTIEGEYESIPVNHEFIVQDKEISSIAIACHKVTDNRLDIFCMVSSKNIIKR